MSQKRGVSIWLAVSLALNAALVGLVGGRILAGPPPAAYETRDDRANERRRVFEDLSPSQRRALRRDLMQVWRGADAERRAIGEARRAAQAAASADPYDREALESALAAQRAAEEALKARIHTAITGRLDELSPKDRVRLLRVLDRPPPRGGPDRQAQDRDRPPPR
ncbi:MAG: periplasmic heavy metal sensor [Pseudomonadota bacterium]